MVDSGITPNEAVTLLSNKLHLEVVRRTILNYEKDDLMPRAWRSDNGREAYYTPEGLAEFYASWKLLHGDFISALPGFSADDKLRLAPKFVSYARRIAYELVNLNLHNKRAGEALDMLEILGSGIDVIDRSDSYSSNLALIFGFAMAWLDYKKAALEMLKS